MTSPAPDEHGAAIQAMFGRIAGRYDLMNRLMTFGQDRRWQRAVVRQARLPRGGWLLDIATGTGDIAREAQRQTPGLHVIAADFTLPMMRIGQGRPGADALHWQAADTLHLPYAAARFDAVTSGYLFRNVADIPGALAEQMRVLKPGGRLVTLDTTPPPPGPLRPLIQMYLKNVIPALGRIVASDHAAYRYLLDSSLGFKTPDELADLMRAAGLLDVQYRRFMFGTVAVHWGAKPPG
jgi:demethylmenaquinone methyltransferase/2-methoxy-6-polyprenyl-1,4-benzoquinol methylase